MRLCEPILSFMILKPLERLLSFYSIFLVVLEVVERYSFQVHDFSLDFFQHNSFSAIFLEIVLIY